MKNLILLSLLFVASLATQGVDVAGLIDNWGCLKSNGMSFGITRGYCSYGGVDPDGVQNLRNIKNAGMIADVYFFPCSGLPAATQVNQFVSYYANNGANEDQVIPQEEGSPRGLRAGFEGAEYMDKRVEEYMQNYERQLEEMDDLYDNLYVPEENGDNYGTVWLDIESNPKSSCSWDNYSFESNCEYIHQLVNALQAKGKKVGIYASLYMWEQILGSQYACSDLANLPLWYAHYDNKPSFSDYPAIAFGGWTKPAIKQYLGDTYLCGDGVDLNFY